MTVDEIRELIYLASETGIAELEVQRGDNRVRIRRAAFASPQEIVATASSRNCTGEYGVETSFATGQGGSHYAGGQWVSDASHNQIAAFTNVGSAPSEVLLTLHYKGGLQKYELQQTIAPNDQLWVNLTQLLGSHTPDRNGNFLPSDAKSFTYDVEEMEPKSNSLIASDLNIDSAAALVIPNCPFCCGITLTSPEWDPDPVDVLISTFDGVSIVGNNGCSNAPTVITTTFTTWSSSNSNVAAVTKAQVQGVSPGNAIGTAQGLVNGPGQCACSPHTVQVSVPINVGPYKIEPISTIEQGAAVCPTGQQGWSRMVTDQLQFANGAGYLHAGIVVADTLTIGSTNQIGLPPGVYQTGSYPTDSNGSWPDSYFVCTKSCPVPGYTNALQTWTYNSLPLGHANSIVYKCTSITIDGF